MFQKIKEKLVSLKLGLADFEQRIAVGLFHGQPNVAAQHIAINLKESVATLSEIHDALVAYETQTNNAVLLLSEDVKALKAAVTDLQDALTDQATAAEIVKARSEVKAATEAEIKAKVAKDAPAAGVGGEAPNDAPAAGESATAVDQTAAPVANVGTGG